MYHSKESCEVNCNADRLAHTNELFKEVDILKFTECVQYKTAILLFHYSMERYLFSCKTDLL